LFSVSFQHQRFTGCVHRVSKARGYASRCRLWGPYAQAVTGTSAEQLETPLKPR
jgi:hypothetical protein